MNIKSIINASLSKGKPINIAFIGDSITSAEWVHPNWREIFEYVLKEEMSKDMHWKLPSWGIRCFNCGFDGSTSKDIFGMLDDKILSLNPDIAIFLANTNDIHINSSPEEYKKDVENILSRLSQKCKAVILANSIPGANDGYNKRYGTLAKAAKKAIKPKNVMYIDIFSKYKKLDLTKLFTFVSINGNKSLDIRKGEIDFCHPNQLGNAHIAKLLLAAIKIKFDPEKYIKDSFAGKMYPRY